MATTRYLRINNNNIKMDALEFHASAYQSHRRPRKPPAAATMTNFKSNQTKQMREFKTKFRKMFKSHQVLFEEYINQTSQCESSTTTTPSSVVGSEFLKSVEGLKLESSSSSSSSSGSTQLNPK